MNRYFIIFVLSIASLGAVLVSCKEDVAEYIRPQYGAITYSPTPAIAGDSVEFYIPQKVKGNGIAATTYTWTIKEVGWDPVNNTPTDTIIRVDDNYDGYGKRDPSLKILLPADIIKGYHQVTMTATFSVYIGSTLFDKVTVNGKMEFE